MMGPLNRSSAERYGCRPDDRCLSHGLNQDGDVGGIKLQPSDVNNSTTAGLD
jgi:hypothetical protein